MNCCDSFGRCTQGANCPVRSTPTPAACIKAKHCLSQTGDCHCEVLEAADTPLPPLDFFDYLCLAIVLLCLVVGIGNLVIAASEYWAGWVTPVVQAIPALPSF